MLIPGIILAVIILLFIAAFPIMKRQREIILKTKKYPEGYLLGQWMGIGMALGIPLGVAMGNMALGPGMGLPLGLAMGMAMEKKYRAQGKIRPMNKEEKEMRKKTVFYLTLVLLLGVVVFLAALWGF